MDNTETRRGARGLFIIGLGKFIALAGCFGIVTGYLSGGSVSTSLAIFSALVIALLAG